MSATAPTRAELIAFVLDCAELDNADANASLTLWGNYAAFEHPTIVYAARELLRAAMESTDE